MKVLLFNEYSGVHKNLKEGLARLGYEDVHIASAGDGWKKIESDICLSWNGRNAAEKIINYVHSLLKIAKMIDYDILQFISPFYFRSSLLCNEYVFKYLIQRNSKSFLYASGCSSIYYEIANSRLSYAPCPACKRTDQEKGVCRFENEDSRAWNYRFMDQIDGIIPSMYEYAEGVRNDPKTCRTIPLPINTDNICYKENVTQGKLVIFHGMNRVGFKGTPIIERALKQLKQKYPNDIDVIVDGQMPLNDYLRVIERANVIVDQVNSYSYGMNAIYSMALGKVVLSGCEKECLAELGLEEAPIINILPDEKDIITKIESLIESRQNIIQLGAASRAFVERIHHYVKVAEQFSNLWRKGLREKKNVN